MDKYTGLMAVYFIKRYEIEKPGPEVVKKKFMLNSTKHEIFPANKC